VPIVHTEPFFDGTRWEASCPAGWTFRHDKTVRGYPYVFESEPGCRLEVFAGRDPWINYGADISRPDITSEPLRIAYVMTLQQARMDAGDSLGAYVLGSLRGLRSFESRLRRHDFEGIAGFTSEKGGRGWAGHFTATPWSLYVHFSAPADEVAAKGAEALGILGTIQFRRLD
jgi:hypothetical protein